MTREDYLAKRTALMDEAKALIDEGKNEDAEAKMAEVQQLDTAYSDSARIQANLTALEKEPVAKMTVQDAFGDNAPAVDTFKSEVYKNAWAKKMMGKPLTNDEERAYEMVNSALTTATTGAVVPTTVADGIWEQAEEFYPYFADVTKTYVNGVLSIIREDVSSDAAWYDEGTQTADGSETFNLLTLGGCELSRAITVSWKLKEMSVEDFIPYIQRKLAKKMGKAAGWGVTNGRGANPGGGAKPEPMGVISALAAESDTPQIVGYAAATGITYSDIVTARSKIKSGYGAGLAIYANSKTIWAQLANVLDDNKRPIFASEADGSIRILGLKVKEDDSLSDGDVLISNASEGYHLNINKDITLDTEDHKKARQTDYIGYAILDGNVTTTKAHALLRVNP